MLTTNVQSPAVELSSRSLYQMPFGTLLCAALLTNFIGVDKHDHQRVLEIVVLLLVGLLSFMRPYAASSKVTSGSTGKLLAAFFALGILGSAMAFDPRFAFFEVATFFLLYLAATAVACEIGHHGNTALRLVLKGIAAAGAFYTLRIALDYISNMSLGLSLDATDFTLGFSNVRFFNHTQTSTLPLLILLCCLTAPTAKLRWLWFAVASYWWMALFATSARGTLMGMVASCAIVAVLRRRQALPYLKQALITAVLGLLAYLVLLVAVPLLVGGEPMNAFAVTAERTTADPASGRMFLWRRAGELIMHHPLLGVGPMHFAHNAGDLHIGAHPHDFLMQIGSEWGLPALACLLAAVIMGIRLLLRAGHRIANDDMENQAILTALLATAFCILVDGLVSGLFVMPQSQLGVALYLGCAIGWQRHLTPTAPQKAPHRALRPIMMASVIAAMVAVVAAVWMDAPAKWRGDDLTPAQQAVNTETLCPRLWTAGFF